MSKVRYDVVATIGTYQNQQGEKKYITRNVGAVIQTQHGFRLKMDACFNPAGCVKSEDGGVWLALFEPKEKAPQQQAPTPAPAPQQSGGYDDSDIPFMSLPSEIY